MHLLALEPFYGGSHRLFLDQWRERSRHRFSLCTLSAHHWKWRMRQSSLIFAERIAEMDREGEAFDLLWCSSMVSVAELVGLLPERVRTLPRVLYFHENQLTYPVREESERDLHFALTNLTSALAADEVWFNSAFHRDSFLAAVPVLLRVMPGPRPAHVAERLAGRCRVECPGVDVAPPSKTHSSKMQSSHRERSPERPLHLVWVSRWEHDKSPETFFEALALLLRRGVDFRVSVLGERFRTVPEVFERARRELRGVIDTWGYREDREEYLEILARADAVVSTAQHEFFGIAVLEAVFQGAYPLVPHRLSYPELFAPEGGGERPGYFHDGTAEGLADLVEEVARARLEGTLDATSAGRAVERFRWRRRAPELDASLEAVRGRGPRASTAARN